MLLQFGGARESLFFSGQQDLVPNLKLHKPFPYYDKHYVACHSKPFELTT